MIVNDNRAVVGNGWRHSLLLIWAVWWGGLSFYAIVVVPIGTELIGSVGQGFITQRVTQMHNGLSVIFLGCLFVEAVRRRTGALLGTTAILLVCDIALFIWHAHLTDMMDFQQRSVPSTFYAEHAIYLWLTAVEWGTGLLVPIWLFPGQSTPSPIQSCDTEN